MSLLRLFTLCIVTLAAGRARAQGVYFSTESVLRSFFPSSQKVGYVELVTAEKAEALRALLGYVPARPKYTLFVARSGEHIDGYAIIDEERGQHLPITFAVQVSADGLVQRTEVMVYREGYGAEIRDSRFRAQFAGKSIVDPIRTGDDVVAVSGATISSQSMAVAVRRAVALVSVWRAGRPRQEVTGLQSGARVGP